MLEPGRYYGPIEKVGTSIAKTGSKQFYIDVQIQHRQSGEEAIAIDPETVTVFLSLTPNAYPYSEPQLEALGFDGNWESPSISAESTEGVWVDCTHESYQGKVKARWSLVSDRTATRQPLTADNVAELNAMWRAKHAPAKPAPPKPKLKAPPPGVAEKNTADDWP